MTHPTTFHPSGSSNRQGTSKFSVLIPTWNNLEMLAHAIQALRRHSTFSHQVIVHVNEGIDGTLEWVREHDLDHTHCPVNSGICYGLNAAATLARTDYLVYLNDDMVVLPGWDQPLAAEIESIAGPSFFLSSTLIEPDFSGNKCAIAPLDFGRSLDEFDESGLLAKLPSLPKQDWTGATWPPAVVHRSIWNLVGGYSTEFTPGFASDPDFSMKLWRLGIRHFKGVGDSLAYHFMSQSTGRWRRASSKKHLGRARFLNKWGMTISTFSRHILRLGEPWEGPLEDPGGSQLRYHLVRSRIKRSLQPWR